MTMDPKVEMLLEANLQLADVLDPSVILQQIVDTARSLVNAKYGALGVVSSDGNHLVDFIHSGLTDEEVAAIGPLPKGRGVLGALLTNAEPLRLDHISDHPQSTGFPLHHPSMSSFLGVPIKRHGDVVGNLYLTEKLDGQPFTKGDEQMVRALAAQAAVAIDKAALYTAERLRSAQAAALVRAVGALVEERDPASVLQVIVDSARALANAEYAALGVLADDGTSFSQFLTAGMDAARQDAIGRLPVGHGTLAAVTVERRAMRLKDLRTHPAFAGFPEGHPEMTTFLGVPLEYRGEVFGNIYLTNKLDGTEFTQQEEDLVAAMAGQAAIALDRARAQGREQETIRRLRALLRANLALTEVLDQDDVLQTIVDLARDLADAEYAALGVMADDGNGLSAFIHSGMSPDVVKAIGPLPRGRGLLGSVIVSERPIRLSKMQNHPASVGFPDNHPPMESFLGVPLAYQGRVLGNLYLTNKRGGDFTEMDEELVTSLAAQAAVAIENAGVIARERELVEQLRTVDEMKTDFVSMVSHELRTPLVALRSGAELLETAGSDLPEEDRHQLRRAIRRQADRLYHLITNLLDLSRMEQGRLAMKIGPTEVEPIVKDIVSTIPRLASLDIRVVLAPSARVIADELYLRQVITNLLVNAANYGAEPITVSAEPVDDGFVEIRVSDEGPGIPEAIVPSLFEKFVRGTRDGDTPGSGLGLALAKALVEEFGGTITHQQRQPAGTTFIVRLRDATGVSQ